MALESADFIHELIEANPDPTSFVANGEKHLSLIKHVLQTQFPDIILKAVINADGTEADDDPDERLWSPLALAAYIAENWDAWGLVSQDGISFKAVMEPTQTIPNNTPTKMQWVLDDATTPGWDTNTNWDGPNNRWTCDQAGTYSVRASVGQIDPSSSADPGDPWDSIIRINGNDYQKFRTATPGQDEQYSAPVQALCQLVVDDYVEIWSHHQLGSTENFAQVPLFSAFEIFRISD